MLTRSYLCSMFVRPAERWLKQANWALHPEVTIVQHLELITCRGTTRLLRVSSETVRHLAAAGELPGRKIGRSWRFPGASIKSFILGSTTQDSDFEVAKGSSDGR